MIQKPVTKFVVLDMLLGKMPHLEVEGSGFRSQMFRVYCLWTRDIIGFP